MTKSQRDTSRGENELLVPKKAEKKFGYFSALQGQFLDLPLSDAYRSKRDTYTKEEVDVLIAAAVKEAVDQAREIDEESMAKHNRDATVISMILGFTTLALFVDGLLRMLGIIPPFMDLDVNILDKIETDIIDKIKQVPIQKVWPFR